MGTLINSRGRAFTDLELFRYFPPAPAWFHAQGDNLHSLFPSRLCARLTPSGTMSRTPFSFMLWRKDGLRTI